MRGTRRSGAGRFVAIAAAVLASACSGAPRPGTSAADGRRVEAAAGAPEASTASSPSAEAAAGPGGAPGGDGRTGPTTATVPPTGGQGTPGGTGGGGGTQRTVANLFGPDDDRVGISDTEIKICGHAALLLADAFDTRPEDLNFYWEKVNAEGGVYGRRVTLSWEDDAYSPDTAVEAAKKCKDKNPFLLLGGIGFDQIPAVRNWAETNKMLYVHHIAIADDAKQYSFSSFPTVQEVGRAFGEYIATTHAGKKVGILYRQSENWAPGHDAGKEYLESRGFEIASDLGVNSNQALYTQQILDMKGKGTQVVWVWENALAAAEFISQAHAQDFHPVFVVFPFQTTLDVVGDQATRSPIEGVAAWPAYKPGGYEGPYAFNEYRLQAEIEEFERVLAQYRPNTTPNDILWQVWLGMKGLHTSLLECGPDCTRNAYAGIMLGGYKAEAPPACPVDFSRNTHKGGWHFLVHEAFAVESGDPYYRNVRWCSEHLT